MTSERDSPLANLVRLLMLRAGRREKEKGEAAGHQPAAPVSDRRADHGQPNDKPFLPTNQ